MFWRLFEFAVSTDSISAGTLCTTLFPSLVFSIIFSLEVRKHVPGTRGSKPVRRPCALIYSIHRGGGGVGWLISATFSLARLARADAHALTPAAAVDAWAHPCCTRPSACTRSLAAFSEEEASLPSSPAFALATCAPALIDSAAAATTGLAASTAALLCSLADVHAAAVRKEISCSSSKRLTLAET